MKAWKEKLKQVISYLDRTLKLLSECGKGYFFLILVFALISGIFPSVSTLIMREIINNLQLSGGSWDYLRNLLIAYISVGIIQSFFFVGLWLL